MAPRRDYFDGCAAAHALDLVGERWALLVVRELLLGPKRFTDLRAGLPHLSPDVLSQRLRELESSGIVRRRKLAPPAASRVYELTEWGGELEPVVLALGRWGSRSPLPADGAVFGADAAVLALKTLFSPKRARGLRASYELRLGEERFAAQVSDGGLELRRGGADAPDAIIETDPVTLAAVLWHGRRLAEAIRSGRLGVEGPKEAVNRFLELFPLPPPVGAPR
jgi:DNA-binding HxlR family transcriptional regulator